MPVIAVPFAGDKLALDLDDAWQARVCSIRGGTPLTHDQLRAAVRAPAGAPPLRDLARGKRSAAVIVEDATRPTPTHLVAPLVVEELLAAGIPEDGISFFSAIAAHRPQFGYEFKAKLGAEIVERFRTYNHNFYDQLDYLGMSKLGTPIYLNSLVHRAELKVTIGSVIPHTHAGYSGGAKSLMPGVCGAKTVFHHHSVRPRAVAQEVGDYRGDIEDIAERCGLDFVVDSVINGRCEIVGLFAGHMRAAHRAAIEVARQVYRVEAPKTADAAIISAHPVECDFTQAGKGILAGTGVMSVVPDGPILLLAACPEGAGHHYIGGRGAYCEDLHAHALARVLGSRRLLVYSPNLCYREIDFLLPPGAALFNDLREALAALRQYAPGNRVNVFPEGALAIT